MSKNLIEYFGTIADYREDGANRRHELIDN